LRISESLGLRWKDIDFETETLAVRMQLGAEGTLVPLKSSAGAASVPLLSRLARELRAHHARQGTQGFQHVHADALVFTTSRQAAITPERAPPPSTRLATRPVSTARAGSPLGFTTSGTRS
jgi:integrase